MSIVDMACKINEWVAKIKVNKDKEYNAMTAVVDYLPTFIIGPLQASMSYLS